MSVAWVEEAKRHLNTREIQDAAKIKGWVSALGPSWFADTFNAPTTPWCGVFVAWCLRQARIGQLPLNYMRASEWSRWGQAIHEPVEGAIAIYEREGGGHVAFVAGREPDGSVVCIGGNQSNMVCLAKFQQSRPVQYRWPLGQPMIGILPHIHVGGMHSTNEA